MATYKPDKRLTVPGSSDHKRHIRPRESIQSIQVLRGIAALAVVFYHVQWIISKPEYGGLKFESGLFEQGSIGVNLFFVLSGFIIINAHRGDIGVPSRLPHYLWRRFSRVYPIYWVLLSAFIIAALSGLGRIDFSLDKLGMASSFLLVRLSSDLELPLKVAWTLFYEIIFYAMFALLILDRRIGTVAMLGWLYVIVTKLGSANAWLMPTSIWNLCFFSGMAAGLLDRSLRARTGLVLLPLGLIGLVLLLKFGGIALTPDGQERDPLKFIVLATMLTMIVLGAALADPLVRAGIPQIVLLLGDASYSIYLTHSAVISLLCILGVRVQYLGASPSLVFGSFALAATLVGVVVHLILERPLLKAMGRRLQPGFVLLSRVGPRLRP